MYPQAQPSRNATLQEIFVTAAETEGDKFVSPPNLLGAPLKFKLPRNSRVDLWKRRLSLHVTRAQMSPRDIMTMMQGQSVSLCAFMPDRLPDPDAHSANQKHFHTLSQMLSRNNLVSFKVFQ